MNSNVNEPSPISNYYKNKSIFVTGATGFLGKALIEKLLRSCYGLNKIYILVRPKKGKTPSQRVDEIVNQELYHKLKELYPDFKNKIVPVEGDLVDPFLGISEKEREILSENVNIVFHSAATVRFDEPLKVAVSMNIVGTKKVIELCKTMKNLEVFQHVSTAYANCPRLHISEEVYNPPIKPESLIEAMEWMDDVLVNSLTPKIIGKWPNTYTFTKAIAEYMVMQETKIFNIPCSIVRPSIICASFREPMPGWVDNFNGPTALFPACGTGLLRTMIGYRDAMADLVPVDIPVNMMVSAAWLIGSGNTKSTLVYNCTSGQINGITWGEFENMIRPKLFQFPFDNIIMFPDPNFTPHRTVKVFRHLFEQMLPAYFLDLVFKVIKQKKKISFVRIQTRITKAIESLEYFTTKEWEFTNENVYALSKQMSPVDCKVFNIDVGEVDWAQFMDDYFWGTKKYLMKEDPSRIKKNLKKMKQLKRFHNFALISIILAIGRFLFLRSKSFKLFIEFIFEVVMKFGHMFLKYIKLNPITD